MILKFWKSFYKVTYKTSISDFHFKCLNLDKNDQDK